MPASVAPARINEFLSHACLTYTHDVPARRSEARAALAATPELGTANLATAAAIGDVATLQRLLLASPEAVNARLAPFDWPPLLYAIYSRLHENDPQWSTRDAVFALLAAGADPNAHYFWGDMAFPPFSALTGAFGKGEQGPTNQSPHPRCLEVARALLDVGASPNDGQTLYNCMFTPENAHLELLFEYGLGQPHAADLRANRSGQVVGPTPAELLRDQLRWAVQHGHRERVRLLASHGVDLVAPFAKDGLSPLALALLAGDTPIATDLRQLGAPEPAFDAVDRFTVTLMAGDTAAARAALATTPSLLDDAQMRRHKLLHEAAGDGRVDAVTTLLDLGLHPSRDGRESAGPGFTPLHAAGWGGRVAIIKLLLARGADPTIRDPNYNGTPRDWAAHNHQTAAVAAFDRLIGPATL